MWPWEHLAVGYLLFSATVRVAFRRPPTDYGALVLAFGTQFPDLIDKPGAWVFDVLPSGTSVGHSVFVAVPLSLVAAELARRRGAPELGVAFGIGYLSHLPADVAYPVLLGRGPAIGAVLWPLGPNYAEETAGVPELVSGFFTQWAEFLAHPLGIWYLSFEIVLLLATLALWVRDGTPGLGVVRRVVPAGGRRGGE